MQCPAQLPGTQHATNPATVQMACSDGTLVIPSNGNALGDYGGWASCPLGQRVVGAAVKYHDASVEEESAVGNTTDADSMVRRSRVFSWEAQSLLQV